MEAWDDKKKSQALNEANGKAGVVKCEADLLAAELAQLNIDGEVIKKGEYIS